MALDKSDQIKALSFNLNDRTVMVRHNDTVSNLLKLLEPLAFGAVEIETKDASAGQDDDHRGSAETEKQEQTALIILLVINGSMFFTELGFGLYAQSTGLIADSLDMLADALVYGVSLFAVGKALSAKQRAATLSGWLQILLAVGSFSEVIRRIFFGGEPYSNYMIGISALALVANVTCLWVISRHRHGGVHMKASWIFSSNDVVANIGVILAGVLVLWTGTKWPDLAIGLIISVLVMSGAIKILKLSSPQKPKPSP